MLKTKADGDSKCYFKEFLCWKSEVFFGTESYLYIVAFSLATDMGTHSFVRYSHNLFTKSLNIYVRSWALI